GGDRVRNVAWHLQIDEHPLAGEGLEESRQASRDEQLQADFEEPHVVERRDRVQRLADRRHVERDDQAIAACHFGRFARPACAHSSTTVRYRCTPSLPITYGCGSPALRCSSAGSF